MRVAGGSPRAPHAQPSSGALVRAPGSAGDGGLCGMTEKRPGRACQPRVERNAGHAAPRRGLLCPRRDTGWWPGGAVARHSAWHQRLLALALVSPWLPCPPGMGWPWSRCHLLRMGVACPHESAAARPCWGLKQAGFCEPRNLPPQCGGVPEHSQPCSSIARMAGSLQIPHSGSAWPAPALAGGHQPVPACQQDLQHPWEQPPRKPRGQGELPAPEGGRGGQKATPAGGARGGHAVAGASELAPEAQQASPLAVPEELSHQAGSAGTFLALLFSV